MIRLWEVGRPWVGRESALNIWIIQRPKPPPQPSPKGRELYWIRIASRGSLVSYEPQATSHSPHAAVSSFQPSGPWLTRASPDRGDLRRSWTTQETMATTQGPYIVPRNVTGPSFRRGGDKARGVGWSGKTIRTLRWRGGHDEGCTTWALAAAMQRGKALDGFGLDAKARSLRGGPGCKSRDFSRCRWRCCRR